jgi:tRNA A-37 threonylcarbamoyl transferase component Bud32
VKLGSFIVEDGCKRSLMEAGIVSIDSVFTFGGGRELAKSNIGKWRQRVEFQTADGSVFFLKRYKGAGIAEQLTSWLAHGCRSSFACFDIQPAAELNKAGILSPMIAAYGEQWGLLFEKRSFSITEKIARGEALERRLPKCFADTSPKGLGEKRAFLRQLGCWAAKFHATGWRHRDFYLAHIFLTDGGELYLIDLQRAFKPIQLSERYRRKDLAQLYYSMPREHFSLADRLRVFLAYTGAGALGWRDKRFIRSIMKKVGKMAEHDQRHGRTAPYKGKARSRTV